MSGRFHVLKGTGTNVKGLQTHLMTFSHFVFFSRVSQAKIKENVSYMHINNITNAYADSLYETLFNINAFIKYIDKAHIHLTQT